MNITTIVFDLGRVLIQFDPDAYMQENFNEDEIKFLKENFFLQNLWVSLDRGDMTLKQVKEVLYAIDRSKYETINRCVDNYWTLLKPFEETASLIEELSIKYRLLFLSNFHKDAFEKIYDMYPFFKLFQGGVVSCYVKELKPEKRIYEILMKEYGLDPANCLFIDDTLENTETAASLGFQTIHLEDQKNMLKELEVLGEKVI